MEPLSGEIYLVDYYLNGCIEGRKSKISLSGSNKRDKNEDLQAANSLPIHLPEKNKEMFPFDLQVAIC